MLTSMLTGSSAACNADFFDVGGGIVFETVLASDLQSHKHDFCAGSRQIATKSYRTC